MLGFQEAWMYLLGRGLKVALGIGVTVEVPVGSMVLVGVLVGVWV